ncbi:hypothetical protein GH714_009056 [Hevea brasiliensis]|uniref:Uncharacterized protein n=1 Tax=Hevea brasiliensis TaxID=3981 RepID=A0A6A6KC10_HEVBR|nr:hypothetical protein GH714_009056 [Hevea brasiliensis]
MAPRRLFTCFGKCNYASSSSGNEVHGKEKINVTVDASMEDQRRAGAIMVELFSSQGCATSPEGELLVSRLGRGDFALEAPVIVLAFHVDYWDYMGWKDPYGSSQWTVRQKAYVEALKLDTMFTPQATIQRPTSESLQVSLSGALRTKVDSKGANIMVALYESGLVTNCPHGENKGRVLSNDYVVRRLEKLCTVKDISAKKTVSGTVNFSLWEGFNSSKCGITVFVQDNSHQIFGSQSFQLPDNV